MQFGCPAASETSTAVILLGRRHFRVNLVLSPVLPISFSVFVEKANAFNKRVDVLSEDLGSVSQKGSA